MSRPTTGTRQPTDRAPASWPKLGERWQHRRHGRVCRITLPPAHLAKAPRVQYRYEVVPEGRKYVQSVTVKLTHFLAAFERVELENAR